MFPLNIIPLAAQSQSDELVIVERENRDEAGVIVWTTLLPFRQAGGY